MMRHTRRQALSWIPTAVLGSMVSSCAGPTSDSAPSLRPSPEAIAAWQNRKFGMFIHWGLYSIPAGMWKGEKITSIYSEQIQLRAGIPTAEYAQLARGFNPTAWNPQQIVELAKAAGMRFIVITAKHHDGFCLFHSRQTSFNAVDGTPYGKDIIHELARVTRAAGLHFGVYFSSIDWHWGCEPQLDNNNSIPKELEDFNVAQLQELTSNYGPLSEIWFDMGNPTPQQSKRLANTVHAAQPDCMVSGRYLITRAISPSWATMPFRPTSLTNLGKPQGPSTPKPGAIAVGSSVTTSPGKCVSIC